MAIYTAFDMVGKKEDISDAITNISPTDTPFQSMIGSQNVWNITYQWQEDSLIAPAANAQLEGFTALTPVANPTVMRSNISQILSKTAQVSGTATAVKAYGRDNELAYQLLMHSKELKRDLEFAYVGLGTAGNGTLSDASARVMNGYQQMVQLTGASAPVVLNGVTATAAGVASAVSTANAGAGNVLTETMIVTVAQQLFTNGVEPTKLMIKPADKLKVAAFATGLTNRQRVINDKSTTITNTVETYVTPFGTLDVVMNRFLRSTVNGSGAPTGDALLFDPEYWKKAVLRPFEKEQLAKTGDSFPTMIVGEYGLIHRNFAASGLILGLAP